MPSLSAKASVLALGIMPYISASIVVQLLGMAVPYMQKLQREGESGRNKQNQITRYLTIAICLVQAPGFLASLPPEAFVQFDSPTIQTFYWVLRLLILVTGCLFAMWLGERITDNGIGRKASAGIKERQNIKHKSFSTTSTNTRFELMQNRLDIKGLGIEIKDLLDSEGEPLGTTVKLMIPCKILY